MDDFERLLNKQLEDPEFKESWEESQPEHELIRFVIGEMSEQNISSKELADILGTSKANISKLENGTANPSLKFIKKLAKALGKRLEIKFV